MVQGSERILFRSWCGVRCFQLATSILQTDGQCLSTNEWQGHRARRQGHKARQSIRPNVDSQTSLQQQDATGYLRKAPCIHSGCLPVLRRLGGSSGTSCSKSCVFSSLGTNMIKESPGLITLWFLMVWIFNEELVSLGLCSPDF